MQVLRNNTNITVMLLYAVLNELIMFFPIACYSCVVRQTDWRLEALQNHKRFQLSLRVKLTENELSHIWQTLM